MKLDKTIVRVNAVARALAILRHLRKVKAPIGVIPLARELNINPSTCFNILRTLTEEGMVSFDSTSKGYSIGMGLVAFSKNVLSEDRTIATFEPALARIARTHDATTFLIHRTSSTRLVILLECMSNGPMRIHMPVGQRLPLLTGATGRVIAAFSDPGLDILRKQFQQVRWGRPLSFEVFQSQVAQTRKRGWGTDDGYFSRGVTIVAVPVFDLDGSVRFTCTAAKFGDSVGNGQEKLVRDLLNIARSKDPRVRSY
jgi:DNA-binding IclR family transcriptional regulator